MVLVLVVSQQCRERVAPWPGPMVTVRSRSSNWSPSAGGQWTRNRTNGPVDGLAEALGVRPPGRRHNGRRRGGSSAGQSSGLIIRQVVGSSPTRPTDFLVYSLTNWHPVSPTVTECHQVMRTRCEPSRRPVRGRRGSPGCADMPREGAEAGCRQVSSASLVVGR